MFSALFSTFSFAGVYQWVDAEGRTHFGDRPPSEVTSKQVQIEAAPAQPDATTRERQEKIESFLDQKQQERSKQQAVRAEAEQRAAKQAEVCQKLRARLKYMKSVSGFYSLNDQGERVFVNDAENSQIRERFREKVQQTCSR
ncbi:DUF4124 domain-containing protein [Marinobacter sp. F4206]|uniref:DUF4124 domain-containing protein n=1 Tax=Marinobacter sp. F4206 TaxID=2861777 RepID=UPI0027E3F8A3|nr:DUF4124 domain-containing protein [Marinobacter sp. F4206]